MSEASMPFSVFTKAWRTPMLELGRFVHEAGFDGIELPVRDGYQVEPDRVREDLPKAARCLAEHGVKIFSVAGQATEPMIEACGEAGVSIIRVTIQLARENVLAQLERVQREYDTLVPLLDRYGVTLGVQNHCSFFVANAMGLHHVIGRYDPKHVAAVWDAAHNALEGEQPEIAIDILWPHLRMVNLKNAYRERTGTDEHGQTCWRVRWCGGREGLASWTRVAAELKRRGYRGVICLCAEYDDEDHVGELIAEDLAFARSLL
jgi:sugar phosphate isomerase/epimerase